jgi:hypothetical protein
MQVPVKDSVLRTVFLCGVTAGKTAYLHLFSIMEDTMNSGKKCETAHF